MRMEIEKMCDFCVSIFPFITRPGEQAGCGRADEE